MKFYLVHDIPPKDNAAPTAFLNSRWRGSWEESSTPMTMQDQCVSIMRHIGKPNEDSSSDE
ncbi:hypothetical protein CES85_0224 [Ochrobactrum quorumnocens]|uniref:Uncharacterized protein n=1 Tax=Ochrobactrum quorumnocens TaxID=271865 RepID=A0A248UHT2_9HYPH|nr:hypothetical protein CES85_0224 [[Ochrobactrum] quorumnocens]